MRRNRLNVLYIYSYVCRYYFTFENFFIQFFLVLVLTQFKVNQCKSIYMSIAMKPLSFEMIDKKEVKNIGFTVRADALDAGVIRSAAKMERRSVSSILLDGALQLSNEIIAKRKKKLLEDVNAPTN